MSRLKVKTHFIETFFYFSKIISGVVTKDLDFDYGSETEAYYGCGISIKGQFWYFGGHSNERQVRTNIIHLTASDKHLVK